MGDALLWWSEQHGLELVSPVARMYLALPAASADLERSFSSAGFLLNGRWRLLVRNLEAQVVIRDYLLELQAATQSGDEYTEAAIARVAALEAAEADDT